MVFYCVSMNLFGWLGLVVFCSWWIRASTVGMGRKFLSDLNGASPILMEMVCWDIVLCIWVVFAIFSILSISMARSKNIGKGKAPSFSMECAVKKRKVDTSQTIKKGKEKLPSKEEIQFLYEVMTGKIIDYALVIWCVMRDFLQSPTENRHIPFPTLVTNLVEATGMRGVVREKRILPKLGPITNQTEAKS